MCHSVINQKIIRADTGQEVDYIYFEPIENTTSAKAVLYTDDVDLEGSTVEYWQLLDLTDG